MNIDEIKRSVFISQVVRQHIELKAKGKEFWGCCPFHDEATASFCVQDNKGKFYCYGCGAKGDVMDFVMKIYHCTLGEAADRLKSSNIEPGAPRPVFESFDPYADLVPIEIFPRDLPRIGQKVFCWNPKKEPAGKFSAYTPSLVHPYRRLDGSIFGCSIRVNLSDKKIVPMLQMIRHNNRRTWSHFPFRTPRPLYGLDQFKEQPRSVLIVEGEKCADAARRFLGHTAVTWAGGGKAVKFTDWSPLAGCNVTLWPDADQEGIDTMRGYESKNTNTEGWVDGVQQLVEKAGAAQVRCLQWDKSKPKGWDVADAFLHDKMRREDVIAWVKLQL